jgi:cytochrome c5
MRFGRISSLLLAIVAFLAIAASAATGAGKDAPPAAATTQDDTTRLQGEQRFRSNCARCHAAPPKFSPRMTATIVRHMRVRATLTDQDMRLIMGYMSR